jgi:hypothetical protein
MAEQTQRSDMRKTFFAAALMAVAFAVGGAMAPVAVLAQQPKAQPAPAAPQQQPQQAGPSAPKPYKPVAVQLPKPVADASFVAFRKLLAGIAQKKDRAGLARLVAQNFFWVPEDKDVADRKKAPIDNLAKAIGLDGGDAPGWDLLAGYADEATADPDPDHPGVLCSPGEATFDDKAAEELATTTQTDPTEWGYPDKDGLEVRSAVEQNSAVIEKLGLHLVRVYPDDSPLAAVHGDVLRIVTPSGKLGYVPTDSILPLATDQLCYVKEGNAWKIAGMFGGFSGPQ